MTEEAIDELVLKMLDKEAGVPHRTHSKLMKSYNDVFQARSELPLCLLVDLIIAQGREAVHWLIPHGIAKSKPEPADVMTFLLESGVLEHVTKCVKKKKKKTA